MNILFLVESFNINRHSSAIGRSKIIHYLSSAYDSTVLYPDKLNPASPNPRPEWLPQVRAVRFPVSELSGPEKLLKKIPKLRALPTYLTGFSPEFNRLVKDWKKAISQELEKHPYDYIITLGTGMSFAPHFALAELNPGIPWIANIHDPYPARYYPPPYQKKSDPVYRKQAEKFGRVLEKARHASLPSLRLKEWLSAFYPVLNDKAFVWPHPLPPDEMLALLPYDQNLESPLEPDAFNLLHAGSLLGPRNPEALIRAFARFVDADPERREKARLYIIGKVTKEHRGIEQKYKHPNIHIIVQRYPYRNTLEILKQASTLILLEAAAPVSPFLPGKFADYVYADKPILALTPTTSETARLLGEDYPYRTETDNVKGIVEKLEHLWEKWKKTPDLVLNRPDLKEYLSGENILRIFEKEILNHHS